MTKIKMIKTRKLRNKTSSRAKIHNIYVMTDDYTKFLPYMHEKL